MDFDYEARILLCDPVKVPHVTGGEALGPLPEELVIVSLSPAAHAPAADGFPIAKLSKSSLIKYKLESFAKLSKLIVQIIENIL